MSDSAMWFTSYTHGDVAGHAVVHFMKPQVHRTEQLVCFCFCFLLLPFLLPHKAIFNRLSGPLTIKFSTNL
jgi:hypothetical protein